MPEPESINRIYRRFPEKYGQQWVEPDTCLTGPRRPRRLHIARNWKEEIPALMEAFVGTLVTRWEAVVRLDSLEKEVALLKERCAVLERLSPILVPIESLAPELYEVVKPFHAVVRYQNEQYIASFFDANLGASGDTQAEAIFNLKDIITGTFEIVTTVDESELGPGPLQQRKVLEQFIRKKD